jgi:hypothetical protein
MGSYVVGGARAAQNTKNKPIITADKARKLLGDDVKNMTNAELEAFIVATEQFARALIRSKFVHKPAKV